MMAISNRERIADNDDRKVFRAGRRYVRLPRERPPRQVGDDVGAGRGAF
jgi:hypothetical protein